MTELLVNEFEASPLVRKIAENSPLVISCAPLQQTLQSKLDDLFSAAEPAANQLADWNVLPKRIFSRTANKGARSRRRRFSTSSAAGRSRRLEGKQSVQMKIKKASLQNGFAMQSIGLASVVVMAIVLFLLRIS